MKKNRIIFIVCLLLCILTLSACASKSDVGKLPLLPPQIDLEDSLDINMSDNVLDERGIFSTSTSITSVEYGADIPAVYSSLNSYSYPKKGVKLDANTSGAKAVFTKIINLNNIDGDVITFEVPRNSSSIVNAIDVELIDIYNTSNKFKVSWFILSADVVSNMTVECNNVIKGGNNEQVDVFGTPRLQYGTTNYLTNLIESFVPEVLASKEEHRPFHFRYDVERGQILADVGAAVNQKNFVVLDIDSPIHMGDKNIFGGFTTGEVYLKLSMSSIDGAGSVIVTSIAGRDLSSADLRPEPSNNIKVGFESPQNKDIPNGKINKAYPLPQIWQKDLLLGDTNITRTLKSPSNKTVTVTDNAFIPTEVGVYKLTYATKDINNNTIFKSFDILIKSNIEDIKINSDRKESQNYLELVTAKLPQMSTSGGSGTPKLDVEYLFNGGVIFPDTVGNYYFDKTGTLLVKVNAIDYIGNTALKTFEYKIVDNATIVLDSALPNAFFANKTIVLPDFTLKHSSQKEYGAKQIFANGELVEANRKITIPNSGNVQIEYCVGKGTEAEISKTFDIKVISNFTNSNASMMFLGNEATVITQQQNGVAIAANAENNFTKFANSISASHTEIYLRTTAQDQYQYVEISLSDAMDSTKTVLFRAYKNSVLTKNFQLQDEYGSFNTYQYPIGRTIMPSERMHFFYDNITKSVYDINMKLLGQIKYFSNGEQFNGFESNRVSIGVKLGGVTGNSSVMVAQLGNQGFDVNTISMGDVRSAQLTPTAKIFDGFTSLNTTFIIPAATAVDVMSINSYVSVNFVAPDGTFLLENANCDKATSFKLDKMGNYTLKFILEDENGNVDEKIYYVTVDDNTSPLLSVVGEYKDTYRVGENITLLDVSITDDASELGNIQTYATVISPNNEYYYLVGGQTFQVELAGKYKILHTALDEAGNYAIQEFTFISY